MCTENWHCFECELFRRTVEIISDFNLCCFYFTFFSLALEGGIALLFLVYIHPYNVFRMVLMWNFLYQTSQVLEKGSVSIFLEVQMLFDNVILMI